MVSRIAQQEQRVFEDQVRDLARNIWPEDEYAGAAILDGKERDGVFHTEDCIHILEATSSRQRDSARANARKLAKLAKDLRKSADFRAVICWLVTKEEPTADQRAAAQKECPDIRILSFRQLQGKLVDAPTYLRIRDQYPFGSIRDPLTGSTELKTDYTPIDIVEHNKRDVWNIDRIARYVLEGGRVILLGDFGSGKSMTLREIYRELRRRHYRGATELFPIFLNLRDHYGQTNPAEVLERHGRNVGFRGSHQLVRSWRAGLAILLLDGFDEVAAPQVQGPWLHLRKNRYRAMEAVRRIVRDGPKDTGLILAGRAHFFDSEGERAAALGLDSSFVTLSLSDFSEEQLAMFLESSEFSGNVPLWLPTRPLLVGYLAARRLLDEDMGEGAPIAPALGWDRLLTRIAEREAEIEAGIDGPTLRRILERLATKARRTMEGLGPVTSEDIIATFEEICQVPADEQALVLLQRLPGLGPCEGSEGARKFIDADLAEACSAGDIVAYVLDPYNSERRLFEQAESALGTLGVDVASQMLELRGVTGKQLQAALENARKGEEADVLVADLVRILMARDEDVSASVFVRDVVIPSLELADGEGDYSRVCYQGCYFKRIEIDHGVRSDRLPRFERCYFGLVDGRVSEDDLPGVFDDECVFETFSAGVETTDAILELDMPLPVRVLLTVLRKLFVQRGAGRKENALYRGIDAQGRRYVGKVLKLLERERIASPYRRMGATIWIPNRSQAARALRILGRPDASGDPLLAETAGL